ncbi:MAG: phage portal protein [Rikenellaceae bacterium]
MQSPNSYANRFDLMHQLMVSVALWGNGYARIFRDKLHRPERLQLLHPLRVEPILDIQTDTLYYRLDSGAPSSEQKLGVEILASDDVIHLKNLSTNGYKGKSPIAVHRDNLSLTMAAQLYGEKFFNQGGNMSGVFKYPSTLKPDAYERLKRDLVAQSVGLHNAHIPLLLEGGMQYERISIPPEDAQFIATRKFQKTEIATIYGIPPHMIADLERATNNNIEHQGMEFVTYCLMPYLVRIEEEFNRKLLRHDEQGEYYFLFGLNALLRGDAKTRSEYYKNMNFIGAMSANEIRAYEDMNSYDGGDEYFVQLNMTPISKALNPNTDDKE